MQVTLMLCSAVLLAQLALPAQARDGVPSDLGALKNRITSIEQDTPRQAIALAQEALSKGAALPQAERLWLLWHLGESLNRTRQYDEGVRIARQGQDEAKSLPVQRVRFGWLATQILHDAGRNKEAREEYEKIAPMLAALAKPGEPRESLIAAANAWRTGGAALSSLARLPESMDLLVRALRLYDELKDQVADQSDTLNEIAFIHFKSGHPDAALREVQRAIDVSEQANQRGNLSRFYLRKSHYLSSSSRVDEQYQALVTARTMAQEEHNDYNLAVIATNLADVALQKKDYRAALRYAEEAIPLAEKSKDRESLLVCWINKGIAMNRLGRPEGINLIQKAIDEFSADAGKQEIAADVQGVLSEELAFNKEFEKAYKAAVDHKKRSDTVRNAADQKRIADADAAYQAGKKQRQIEALEQEQRNQARFRMLWILAGALGAIAIIVLLISRLYLKRAYRKVSDMSLRDPLTGLRNRRYLANRIDEDLAQVRRQRQAHAREHEGALPHNADVIFMMIDLDHFKAINDEHGHSAGDAVLKQFSAVLLRELRDSDTVVRWGGEEFLVVAKQSSAANARQLAERIRASVAAHGFVIDPATTLHRTCSIGYACYPFPSSDQEAPRWEEVVELADQCLYAAKGNGRNAWVGVVPREPASPAPSPVDVPAGVRDGVLELQHSGDRPEFAHAGQK